MIGLISSITAPMPERGLGGEETGLAEINLTGEIYEGDDGRLTFRRGVSQLPSLSDPVLLADRHDLTRIYAPRMKASIKVGSLFQDPMVPARLLYDELLNKHFIVVGSTGSGKSCAVTTVLKQLLEGHRSAHVVILDIHNEYAHAFGDLVEKISLDDFNLPLWMLNFHELCIALTREDGHQEDEAEILNEAVIFAKKRYADAAAGRAGILTRKPTDAQVITVDTPAPFRVSDVVAYIDEQLGKLERLRARSRRIAASRRGSRRWCPTSATPSCSAASPSPTR